LGSQLGENPVMKLPGSILFLCGQNVIRSPIAEQLARAVLPATVFIASAGVRPGERDPFVDSVLAERGLTLGKRQPQLLDDLEDAYFDLIVTLAPEAHHAALELTRSAAVDVEYWPTGTCSPGWRRGSWRGSAARVSRDKRCSQAPRDCIGSAQIRPSVEQKLLGRPFSVYKGIECRRKKSSNFRVS
jgi:protein-tyrosine-phosphatase